MISRIDLVALLCVALAAIFSSALHALQPVDSTVELTEDGSLIYDSQNYKKLGAGFVDLSFYLTADGGAEQIEVLRSSQAKYEWRARKMLGRLKFKVEPEVGNHRRTRIYFSKLTAADYAGSKNGTGLGALGAGRPFNQFTIDFYNRFETLILDSDAELDELLSMYRATDGLQKSSIAALVYLERMRYLVEAKKGDTLGAVQSLYSMLQLTRALGPGARDQELKKTVLTKYGNEVLSLSLKTGYKQRAAEFLRTFDLQQIAELFDPELVAAVNSKELEVQRSNLQFEPLASKFSLQMHLQHFRELSLEKKFKALTAHCPKSSYALLEMQGNWPATEESCWIIGETSS